MHLSVFAEISGSRVLAGAIDTLPGSGEQFTYSDEWIEGGKPPLSISLPTAEGAFPARRVRAYFEGLLPEGDTRTIIRQQLGLRSDSYLKLLEALGGECIGAVSFAPETDSVSASAAYVPLSDNDLRRLAFGGARFAEEMAVNSRLSLAGAQSKTGLYQFSESSTRWFKPVGAAASTHIAKPHNARFEHLVENELFCLNLARQCGIEVSRAFLTGENKSLFVVERYDRKISSDGKFVCGMPLPQRLHQEDFCQALGIPSSKKYEKPGQRYVSKMAALLRVNSADSISDLNALWDRIAFNYLVGNCDAHLKNYSLLRSENWEEVRLAPAYDLVSTAAYTDLDDAMGFGVGTASRLCRVERASFTELAKEMELAPKRMLARLDELRERLCASLEGALPGNPIEERICEESMRRAESIGSFR